MKTAFDPRHQQREKALQSLFSWSFTAKKSIRNKLASKVLAKKKEIDKIIAEAAPEWPIKQINKVDLAILRLAIYELIIAAKEPPKVIIDEAVELAKTYGGEKSSSFVNGVLGTVFKKPPKTMKPEEKIKEIISEKFGVPLEEIIPSANLTDDLGANPVEVADLLVSLEEELKTNFPEEEKEKIKTVEQLINLVAGQVSEF